MKKLQIKKLATIISMALLSSCGGGGGSSSSSVSTTVTPPTTQCTASTYYPLCANTYIRYSNTMIATAHINTTTNEVVVDSLSSTPNPLGAYMTLQSAIHTCPSLPGKNFYSQEWNFSNTGLPTSGAINPASALWISDYSVNGISYYGEGDGGYITPGEAEITMNPVAGEVINGSSILATSLGTGCAGSAITNPAFTWQYQTVKHVDSWNGFNDVWLTTIVEWGGDSPPKPTYYEQAFANGIGMVGLWCWRPSNDNNFYSCGNYYLAVFEGND